ncbi:MULTISPECIES: CRISPR-associated protein Csx3 [Spirulina sp. CCY15215]|uniref:CRISPR-associated protein Csx3 n=1 Tax=Spirulina sp. CCY15215 TaxID=2767591 RepID=UPI001952026D|nr:CRISPR-associated protein Csx3 [Spirulina major]
MSNATVMTAKNQIELQVVELLGENGTTYQTAIIFLQVPKIDIDLLPQVKLPDGLDRDRGVILFGQAPIWLYARLSVLSRNFPWVAHYGIREKQAIVISSRVADYQPGDEIALQFNHEPCATIVVGGPADSGKSHLSYALIQMFEAYRPDLPLYLHRANWDGEGIHTYETPDPELAKKLVNANTYRLHQHEDSDRLIPKYFQYHADAIANIRSVRNLALVDVGGWPQPEKRPVVEQCTHSIIISRYPEKIPAWQELFAPLQPLAVIHSILEERCEIVRTKPYLEIIAGKWQLGCSVPDVLRDRVLSVVG